MKVVALFVAIIVLRFASAEDEENNTLPDLPGPIFYRILKDRLRGGRVHQLYESDDQTFGIVDRLRFFDYRPMVSRTVTMMSEKRNVHSFSFLKFPKGRTYADTDTRKWKVDKLCIVNKFRKPFEFTILDAMFSSGAVKRGSDTVANILGIGLGGASFNNYLSFTQPNFNITMVELNPVMKSISLDWFDMQLHAKHSVYIEDGVHFLEREANIGALYDAVILDASHSDLDHFTMVPVAVFYEDQNLKNLVKVLGNDGILISNLYIGQKYDLTEGTKYIADIFKQYFNHVEIRHVRGMRHKVLLARQKTIHRIEEDKAYY